MYQREKMYFQNLQMLLFQHGCHENAYGLEATIFNLEYLQSSIKTQHLKRIKHIHNIIFS